MCRWHRAWVCFKVGCSCTWALANLLWNKIDSKLLRPKCVHRIHQTKPQKHCHPKEMWKKAELLIQHPLTVSLHKECHCSSSCVGQQKPSREIPSVKRKTAYGYVFESWKLIIIYNTFTGKHSKLITFGRRHILEAIKTQPVIGNSNSQLCLSMFFTE